MLAMSNKWKRRNYFIKPDVQGRVILITFMMVFFCCVLYAVILANFSADSMTMTYRNSNLQLGKTPVIMFREMMKAQAVLILSGGIGVVVVALIISHRFAGPMHKLECCTSLMLQGDHSFTIKLRAGDEGQELAAVINRYNEKFSGDISELRAITSELNLKLALLEQSIQGSAENGAAEASYLLNQLQSKLQQYKINSQII